MKYSKAQIVATIGPASENPDVLREMLLKQVDVVRLNFSWGSFDARSKQISTIRSLEKEFGKKIPIIVDLPGPRLQGDDGHKYDKGALSAITAKDEEFIEFAVKQGVDYISVSFVSSASDIEKCRDIIKRFSGNQKVIAKIERFTALHSLDSILESADAVMIARGDLGNEVPLEEIPFIQADIIKKAKEKGKPVITATQMLSSMVKSQTPTRAEVTDIVNAILEGTDAVMLSEETAEGEYPVDAVDMMERGALEAEKHLKGDFKINPL